MSYQQDNIYPRLEEQINWYDTKSKTNQRWFKGLKYLEIICGALIPLLAKNCPWITGILGVCIVLFEAMQHINQFQHNWITYRSTCEYLKHEKYLYLAHSGPYINLSIEKAKQALAERVESLISTEHAKWIIGQEKIKHTEKNK